jgi:hypothetical protein
VEGREQTGAVSAFFFKMTVQVQVILNSKYYNLITEIMSGQSSRILKKLLGR